MFLAFCVLVTILFSLFYLYRRRNVTYWERRGVPTAKGCHWFFGHYKDILLSRRHLGLMFDAFYNEFPDAPYVGYLKMDEPGLLIRDPDLIKAVMQTDFNSFAKNELFVNKKVDIIFGNNPFSRWGEEWRQTRADLTPHFTYVKLKHYCPVITGVADAMVKYVTARCQEDGNVALFESKSLAGMFTTDAVANALFGVKNDTFKNGDSLFAALIHDIFEGTFGQILVHLHVFLFPEFRPFNRNRLVSKRTEKNLISLVRKILPQRALSTEMRVDIFQEIVNQRQNGKTDVFTDEYVASQIYTCILDGHETVSSVISFVLFELAWNSDVQERLRDEVRDLAARTQGNYTIDDIEDFKYLDMVICESQRLHVPLLVRNKLCTADYTLPDKSLTIKKDTVIAICTHSLHRDPRFYPEPERFDPERFTDEEVAKRHKFVYLAFGEGPRRCLGQRFGLLQTKIAVMKLVEHFQIIPSPKTDYQLQLNPKAYSMRETVDGTWIQMRKFN